MRQELKRWIADNNTLSNTIADQRRQLADASQASHLADLRRELQRARASTAAAEEKTSATLAAEAERSRTAEKKLQQVCAEFAHISGCVVHTPAPCWTWL